MSFETASNSGAILDQVSGVRTLIELIQGGGSRLRHLLRETDTPYTELGHADENGPATR